MMNGSRPIAAEHQRPDAEMSTRQPRPDIAAPALTVVDLGVMEYCAAWEIQLQWHQKVVDGKCPSGVLLLVEHPPVITIGRHPGSEKHLLADAGMLAALGVAVQSTDRGGDITFHGPGQLVVYPIIPLNRYNLRIHEYLRLLESAVIRTLAGFQLDGQRDSGATGVWLKSARAGPDALAKVCAIGIKLRRWVSLHGLALNVRTNLSLFDLINPCGLGRAVTSLAAELGPQCPDMSVVKKAMTREISAVLGDTFHGS